MAVKVRRLRALVLFALTALSHGCRELALCEGEWCEPVMVDNGAAGADSDTGHGGQAGDAGGAGEAVNPHTGAGGSSAGADGNAGRGEAGETGVSCEGGRAECDGSPLTRCETEPSFTVRHCGACDRACDGACVVGTCKPATLLFTGSEARYFVATQTFGYALFWSQTGEDSALVMFDLASGAAEVAMEGLSSEATLTLAVDALYIHSSDEVLRVGFDGKLMAKEDVGNILDFAATQDGVYLIRHDEGDGEEVLPTYSLLYRANHATEFEQLLRSERETRIESWSPYGVVLLEDDPWDDTDETKLALVNETSIRALGSPPPTWLSVIPREGVAAVLALGDEGVDLWWMREDEVRRQPLGVPRVNDKLLIGRTGVWLHLDENNAQYLQQFDEDGTRSLKIGLPYEVAPIFVSATHVWYSDADWLLDPSYLMRTEQFTGSDL